MACSSGNGSGECSAPVSRGEMRQRAHNRAGLGIGRGSSSLSDTQFGLCFHETVHRKFEVGAGVRS